MDVAGEKLGIELRFEPQPTFSADGDQDPMQVRRRFLGRNVESGKDLHLELFPPIRTQDAPRADFEKADGGVQSHGGLDRACRQPLFPQSP